MRVNIEKNTGTNLANISQDNLEKEIKFYEKYSNGPFGDSTSKEILSFLKLELLMRKSNIDCFCLLDSGMCCHEGAIGFFGESACSKLSGGTCLAEQVELFNKL